MKVIGIDPGTGRLGWAIVEKDKSSRIANGGVALVDCGLIESPANTPLSDRLKLIHEGLSKTISKFSPDEMAIEELFFAKNIKTGISVAHARGVAMLSGAERGLPIYEYKPNEIKLGICGYGHADKKQMSKMVELHIRGCKIEQDDTADAVAIALYHLQCNKIR